MALTGKQTKNIIDYGHNNGLEHPAGKYSQEVGWSACLQQFKAVVLNLWVTPIGKHLFLMVLGTETSLSSKNIIMK